MKFQPKQDISNGSWHAARPIVGTDMWHSEVEAFTKAGAQAACDELNYQATRTHSVTLENDAQERADLLDN